jgi:Cof subfamily protein (haloacid dehalogenase superfamily)
VRAIEAVVTDLDGTVVRRDGTVTPATLRAAADLRARGIPLIAATARTPTGLRALSDLAGQLTFAVCCSGAVGVVPATGSVSWKDRLPRSVVADLVAHLTSEVPGAGAAVFDGREWRMTESYRALRPSTHKGPVSVVGEASLAEADGCSMVVCHPERSSAELLAALDSAGFGLDRVTLTYAGPRFVEVTAASVTKASGVLRALRTVGVAPERAIAFGDMPIDVAMFTIVGHSVAMADAPAEVLAVATSQTAGVDDDGFARELIRLGVVTGS